MTSQISSILLADDHPQCCKELQQPVNFKVITEASNAAEAVTLEEKQDTDMMFFDLNMQTIVTLETMQLRRRLRIRTMSWMLRAKPVEQCS